MFKGSIVALVTPFRKGKVDEEGLKKLVEFHVRSKTDGIVPCGTTGESATLSWEEHCHVVDVVVKAANKRIPVLAGTGSNSTAEAIELTKHAEKAGADAGLLISPYYNRPTQEGLFLHFRKVAESVRMPLVIYNIPSRTAVNIEPETMSRLSEIKNIVAVKESCGNLDQISRMISLCKNRIAVLSGDDSLTLPIMSIGGTGVISVTANIVPEDVKAVVDAFAKGDTAEAMKMHYKLLPLTRALFLETNPGPVKTAMALMKMDTGEVRLPLAPMSELNKEKLAGAMKDYGLL